MKLFRVLQFAGLLHIGLIAAGALMPRVVGLRAHLAALPGFIRRLFWVCYAFIGLCLVSLGLLTVCFAETLAGGTPLARTVCLFFSAFWPLRLVAATFVLNVRPYLANPLWRLGYHATNRAFVCPPIAYLRTATRGGSP